MLNKRDIRKGHTVLSTIENHFIKFVISLIRLIKLCSDKNMTFMALI